jgi:hypothetical protein
VVWKVRAGIKVEGSGRDEIRKPGLAAIGTRFERTGMRFLYIETLVIVWMYM